MSVRLLLAAVLLLWTSSAEASPLEDALGTPRIDLVGSVGTGQGTLYLRRSSHAFRLGLRPVRFLGFDLLIAGLPDGGDRDLTPLLLRRMNVDNVTPRLTRALSMTHLSVSVAPLLGRFGDPTGGPPIEFAWFFVFGGAAVLTQEDLVLRDDPCALVDRAEWASTEGCELVEQTHPAFLFGSGLRFILRGGLLIGIEARVVFYDEDVVRGDGAVSTYAMQGVLGSFTLGGSIPIARR